jgi:non-ribosomal peptide synthetase component F
MGTSHEAHLAAGFLASARRYPERAALFVNNRSYSYRELEDAARRWANVLVAGADRPLERVGVFAYRSATAYTGVLAALFAGAAFVPLNKTFPTARTRAMIERADLDAIIVDDASLPQLADVLAGLPRVPRILLPTTEICPEVAAQIVRKAALAAARPLDKLPAPRSVAYLLFTSGSTGVPKGMPVTHANATYFMAVNQARYQLTPDDRLTQMFDQRFDLSVFDLFMAWNAGACSYVPQPLEIVSPFRFVKHNRITVWF